MNWHSPQELISYADVGLATAVIIQTQHRTKELRLFNFCCCVLIIVGTLLLRFCLLSIDKVKINVCANFKAGYPRQNVIRFFKTVKSSVLKRVLFCRLIGIIN